MSANAHASVMVTLEIQVGGGAWGAETHVAQVHRQALAEVQNRLASIMKDNPGVRVVGEMKVNMITHPLDRLT